MIHPYELCKSVVCVYDNKWVLLDGKTQVPRAGTLCTADVRYGIGVNTSTAPHLQVDSSPKVYQASSITAACQRPGREPEQIPAMQICSVGSQKSWGSTCLLPEAKYHTHHIQPPCSQCQMGRIWPHTCCCHSIKWCWQAIKGLHQVPVEQQVQEPCWGQPGQGRVETEPTKRSPTQHPAQRNSG